ncbi:hypothetical protein MWU59_08705 [Flavobacteriaceae bacterium F08102]|nr:hypothetical protein [Flavobacteriaceae bacterium F08102]
MYLKNALHLFLLPFSALTSTHAQEYHRNLKEIAFTTPYKFSEEIETKVVNNTVPWKYQISTADYANKGDYKNALKHWDFAYPSKRKPDYSQAQINRIHQKYRLYPAVDFIVEKAKSARVVIIDETHHNSFHRLFTTTLLQKLYDEGYTQLGLEAMMNGRNKDSLLMDRKYPVLNTGFYTQDPQFGNMIRKAISIGYNVFPYEQTMNLFEKDREIAQAKNIQQVMEQNPNEKFLIHCGCTHVLNSPYPRWGKTMAGRLYEFTGIEPLTITQTAFQERYNPKHNSPFIRALNPQESSVLLDAKNHPFQHEFGKAYADIAVLHPITTYINDRPHWLFENGQKTTSILLDGFNISFPVMVLAYKKGEDIHTAIPVDLTEVNNPTEICHLGLAPGHYKIVLTNGTETLLFEERII